MPWKKVRNHPRCKPGQIAVVQVHDGRLMGCHDDEEAANAQLAYLNIHVKGGPGSGNWGHAGRPGQRGGSAPRSSGAAMPISHSEYKLSEMTKEQRERLGKKLYAVRDEWRDSIQHIGDLEEYEKRQKACDLLGSIAQDIDESFFDKGSIVLRRDKGRVVGFIYWDEYDIGGKGAYWHLSALATIEKGHGTALCLDFLLKASREGKAIGGTSLSTAWTFYQGLMKSVGREDLIKQVAQRSKTGVRISISAETLREIMEPFQGLEIKGLKEDAEKFLREFRKKHDDAGVWFIPDKEEKGGPGSGNWGHAGRPGQRGGSAPRSSGAAMPITHQEYELRKMTEEQRKKFGEELTDLTYEWEEKKNQIQDPNEKTKRGQALDLLNVVAFGIKHGYRESGNIILRRDKGSVVGFLMYEEKGPNTWHLADLATIEKGNGTPLIMDFLLKAGRERKTVSGNALGSAWTFYEGLFKATGRADLAKEVAKHEPYGVRLRIPGDVMAEIMEPFQGLEVKERKKEAEKFLREFRNKHDDIGVWFHHDPDQMEVPTTKGGPGSGNWGHAGRPGQRGGSAPKSVVIGEPQKLTKTAISKYIQWSTSRYNEYPKKYVVDTAYRMLTTGKDEYGESRAVFSSGGYTPSSAMTGNDYLVDGEEKYIARGVGWEIDDFVEHERVYFTEKEMADKGGPGSGNWGHAGRPGQRGGSSPGGGLGAVPFQRVTYEVEGLGEVVKLPKEYSSDAPAGVDVVKFFKKNPDGAVVWQEDQDFFGESRQAYYIAHRNVRPGEKPWRITELERTEGPGGSVLMPRTHTQHGSPRELLQAMNKLASRAQDSQIITGFKPIGLTSPVELKAVIALSDSLVLGYDEENEMEEKGGPGSGNWGHGGRPGMRGGSAPKGGGFGGGYGNLGLAPSAPSVVGVKAPKTGRKVYDYSTNKLWQHAGGTDGLKKKFPPSKTDADKVFDHLTEVYDHEADYLVGAGFEEVIEPDWTRVSDRVYNTWEAKSLKGDDGSDLKEELGERGMMLPAEKDGIVEKFGEAVQPVEITQSLGGAQSWDEYDEYMKLSELQAANEAAIRDFRYMVQNILDDEELDMAEKSKRVAALADGLPDRVEKIVTQSKEADLSEESIIAKLVGMVTRKAKPTRMVDGKPHTADDFAYVPDPETPSTWKLPIFDEDHISMAITALQPSGFRGQKVDIPADDKSKVLSRISAAINKIADDDTKNRLKRRLEAIRKEKSFYVFKDNSGSWRWFGWVSNKFRDRDYGRHPEGEVLAEAAHKEYIAWVDANPQERMPRLLAWHIPQTATAHKADWVEYSDGFLMASGPLTPEEAERIKAVEEEYRLGMSHGFIALDKDEKEGIIEKYRTFEMTYLPIDAAANPWTDFLTVSKEVEQMGLSEKKREFLSKLMGDEFVEEIEQETEAKTAALVAAGVDYKEGEEPEPEAATDEETTTEEEAEEPAAEQEKADEEEPEAPDPVAELRSELGEAMKAIGEQLHALNERIDNLQVENKQVQEAIEEVVGQTPKVSLKDLFMGSVIGKEEAKVDGRVSLAKDGPEETKPEEGIGAFPVPILGQIKQRNMEFQMGVKPEVE